MAVAPAVLAAAALPGTAWGALELTVSPPPSVAVTGDNASITASVKNTGNATETEVSIQFLGQDTYDAKAKQTTTTCFDFILLSCPVGDLAPGQSASVTVTYGPLKPESANVQVSATGVFPPFLWTTPVSPPAKLSLDLAAQPASLTAGNATAVAATVKNSGAGPAFGATLSVSLPFGLTPASLPAGCSAVGLSLTCALGDLPSQATSTTTIPITPPEAGTYTVGASTKWARQSSITGDLTIGVLAPSDPDTGSSGLPIDPNVLTPATPETVTLERITRGLPGRNRCVRDRVLDVLLRSPGGVDPKTAVVRIGRKVVKRLKGSRATAPFTIRVPRSGRFVVRVSVTLTDGRILMASRTYRVCRRR